jgi:hypothetical protein
MKRTVLCFAAAAALLLVASSSVQAAPISLTPSSGSLVLYGNQTSQAQINTALAAFFAGYPDPVLELYKSDRGCTTGSCVGTDSGPYSSSYETTFLNPDLPDADARIRYLSGPIISASPIFALIKDGSFNNYAWYLFDITGWNGTDNIEFSGFYGGGATRVSHVTLYGSPQSVPDGGSMAMLLGIALLGIGGARRMLR